MLFKTIYCRNTFGYNIKFQPGKSEHVYKVQIRYQKTKTSLDTNILYVHNTRVIEFFGLLSILPVNKNKLTNRFRIDRMF